MKPMPHKHSSKLSVVCINEKGSDKSRAIPTYWICTNYELQTACKVVTIMLSPVYADTVHRCIRVLLERS